MGALERRSPVVVEERIYNCRSTRELINDGLSESPELRLFETGCSDDKVLCWVTEPLFLPDQPAELCQLWEFGFWYSHERNGVDSGHAFALSHMTAASKIICHALFGDSSTSRASPAFALWSPDARAAIGETYAAREGFGRDRGQCHRRERNDGGPPVRACRERGPRGLLLDGR